MKIRRCAQSFALLAAFSAVALSTALPNRSRLVADEPARPARSERSAGGSRGFPGLPPGLTLSEEQQAKYRAIEEQNQPKLAELNKKREAILTDEQKANAAKAREAGGRGASIQEALKLTDEQKSQMAALEKEAAGLRRGMQAQLMALLTDEQRTTFHKSQIAAGTARMFTVPAEITLSDEQKAKLTALEEELLPKVRDLALKEALIMTDERRAAREAVMQSATEGGKSLRDPAVAESIDAALKMTPEERTQLAEVQKGLGELRQQVQDRKQALLTSEQKEQWQKLTPARGRN